MMGLMRWLRYHWRWSPQIKELERRLDKCLELHHQDMLIAFRLTSSLIEPGKVQLHTDHPIAIETDDHRFPWGAANDNTRSPRFVAACERHFNKRLTALDLGCSGGGLILDYVLRGHEAVGLEGSDAPLRSQRAEWRLLYDRLFTCDVTRPFRLTVGSAGELFKCDVITAWEVLEHIADADLPSVFANVRSHLAPDGLFVGSVTTAPDNDPITGAVYHRTVQPKQWWLRRFESLGLTLVPDHPFAPREFCRGSANGPLDRDFERNPELGFHFVLCQNSGGAAAMANTSRSESHHV